MYYGIRDEYAPTFGRQNLTVWSGAFSSDYEGVAQELPSHDGYMVTMRHGHKVRVTCESPRTDDNWMRVDDAIRAALALEDALEDAAETMLRDYLNGRAS